LLLVRALISVYDKTGIVEFARQLVDLGWEILSTGGTLRTLREDGIAAIAVADVTGFPEILDGRVKTLHPAIHVGCSRGWRLPAHRAQLEAHDIEPIGIARIQSLSIRANPAASGDRRRRRYRNRSILVARQCCGRPRRIMLT